MIASYQIPVNYFYGKTRVKEVMQMLRKIGDNNIG